MIITCPICLETFIAYELEQIFPLLMTHYISDHWSIMVMIHEVAEDNSKMKSTEEFLRAITGRYTDGT